MKSRFYQVVRWGIVVWMWAVLVTYYSVNWSYFQQQLSRFLPLFIGH
jgi:hypothetical protein